MDADRFDALAKRLAVGVTRRGMLRGLAGLTGAGIVALMGRSGSAADCISRCDRLPAGPDRDQCQAACAAADQARADAEAKAAQARAEADEARATAEAEANSARATAEAEANAARAQADALRACGGDESRLCGSGATISCCAPDERCQNGVCGRIEEPCSDCAAGEDCCAGTCANLQTDPNNCGSCGAACTAGQVCDAGACCTPATCPAGQCGSFVDGCGGTLDCGCATGQVCREGTCCTLATCQPGQCGSPSDGCGGILHCGGCGAGETCCAGECANLESDPKHCGTCGNACPAGPEQGCCNGECAELCYEVGFGCCPTGKSCCGSVCCPDGDCCDGAECCEAGQTCCDSSCCPTGDCCGGVECCDPGACCESAGTCCPSGQICCGDQCTDLNDTDNCGTCDNTSAPGQVCLGRDGCCTPGTCEGRCGTISDGCGGTLDCGDDCDTSQCLTCDSTSGNCVTTCSQGQVCNQGSCCTLATCQPKQCGSFPDGCGGTLDCGTCPGGQICVNNGCFIAGNSETCTESTTSACPCNSNQDCCDCSNDFASTPYHICWRAEPEPAQIDCRSDADCPRGWACFTNSDDPSCLPPC